MPIRPEALPIERVDYPLMIDSPQPLAAPTTPQAALGLSLLFRGALKNALERSNPALLRALFTPEAERRARGETAPSNTQTPGFRLHVCTAREHSGEIADRGVVLRLTLFGRAIAMRGEIERALALAFIRRGDMPCLLEARAPARHSLWQPLPAPKQLLRAAGVALRAHTPWLLGKATAHIHARPEALPLLQHWVKRAHQVSTCWGDATLVDFDAWAAWQAAWLALPSGQGALSARIRAHRAHIGSGRQHLRYNEPGVCGSFELTLPPGLLGALWPLLSLSQQLGVGSQTTGGYGRLRLTVLHNVEGCPA